MFFNDKRFFMLYKQRPSPVGEGGEAVHELNIYYYFAAETDEVVRLLEVLTTI